MLFGTGIPEANKENQYIVNYMVRSILDSRGGLSKMQKIVYRVVKWLVKKYLVGYHIHKDPAKKNIGGE